MFTGSRPGKRPEFAAAARVLGELLAKSGIRLVYGGGRVGLMGVVADAALASGGEVIGVIPEFLAEQEVMHQGLTDIQIVGSMAERKQCFDDLSDGYIAMAGGFGTLDELFEVLTGAQLNQHARPIGLLNTALYFDPLLRVAESMLLEGFVRPEHMGLWVVEPEPQVLLAQMNAYEANPVRKWG